MENMVKQHVAQSCYIRNLFTDLQGTLGTALHMYYLQSSPSPNQQLHNLFFLYNEIEPSCLLPHFHIASTWSYKDPVSLMALFNSLRWMHLCNGNF